MNKKIIDIGKLTTNGLLLLFTISLLSCIDENGGAEKKAEDPPTIKIERSTCNETGIDGKQLKSISEILMGISLHEDKIVFLFTNFDCSTCIEKGFLLCDSLQRSMKHLSIFIISPEPNNIGIPPYKGLRYCIDSNDLLRRELLYCYTPLIMYLNEVNEVLYSKTIAPNTENVISDFIQGFNVLGIDE